MAEIDVDLVELEVPVTEDDHLKGREDAPLTLVEYADYQCEACIAGFHAVEELLKTHRDRVNVVFRHFPLMSYHPMAMPGALAAEAAGQQGEFWAMHAKIFSAGGEFDEEDLVRWAAELGLDMGRFEADRRSEAVEQRIRTMRLEGARSGVNGTPTFFLDNWRIDVAPTHEHLAAYVDHFYAHIKE
ncbi:MAG: DsbA family protein [Armatimonadota bacterium]